MILLPSIDPKKEVARITTFIKKAFKNAKKRRAVVGLSGGIDSATSLFLLSKVIESQNIHVVYLPYFSIVSGIEELINQVNIPKENIHILPIKSTVDAAAKTLGIRQKDTIRLGNVMARTRMIFLFDLAKKVNGLVCGTENKSEHLLGYFTRYGDEASDFEPLRHLYKTQLYQLAKYVNVPVNIIQQTPTAGLWQYQTDEKQLGFSYQEADQVLYLYFDKHQTLDEIKNRGFKNAEKIIEWTKNNHFKHEVPYVLK